MRMTAKRRRIRTVYSPYQARYDKSENSYILRFDRPEGEFSGERAVKERKISVRFHCIGGKEISSVFLNGEQITYKKIAKDTAAFPFAAEGGARDADVICIQFDADCGKAYELKIQLG